MPAEDFDERVTSGYAAKGAALDLGRGVLEGVVHPAAHVQVPLAMMNRHGLIAGATGTGKTKTLQLLAEQLSRNGVPVFAADIKGDLSGITRAGEASEKVTARVSEMQIEWSPAGFPAAFWSLGGSGPGVPIRATVDSFGADLLAKVMGANETQRSSLALVFHYARDRGLALIDLADLRAVLQYLTSDDGKLALKEIGGLSSATAGVLLRKIIEMEEGGAGPFFGEPALDVAHLFQMQGSSGVVNLLELAAVQDKPKLFSTFLMWLLAELFRTLPEVGDLDKPKLVFFFDEAHLLFNDASPDFLNSVAQTVRLIRSKGIGVFFVTQLPDDVPQEVLAQLGNRVQHALRAFTPRDAKALRAAVSTYPRTSDYELESALTQLGTGEAIVTSLSEKGAPTPVVWTKLRPPMSLMAALTPDEIDSAARSQSLWAPYATPLDRESAREQLRRKDEGVSAPDEGNVGRWDGPAPEGSATVRRPAPRSSSRATRSSSRGGVGGYLNSREGRSMLNTVVKGLFSLLRRR